MRGGLRGVPGTAGLVPWGFSWDLIGFNGTFMGINGTLMGFNGMYL